MFDKIKSLFIIEDETAAKKTVKSAPVVEKTAVPQQQTPVPNPTTSSPIVADGKISPKFSKNSY